MLLRAAGFATMATATSPAALVFSCVLSGLGGMLFDPPRAALIIKLTRQHERNHFYTLLMMWESAAAVSGAMLGSWLLHFEFWWVGMGGCAVFVLAAAANLWLLPAYRVASGKTSPLASIRTVLGDRRYMRLVLTLSGYYVLGVQIMLLVPIVLKQMAGTPQVVGWLYALETTLSLTLLYPLAKLGERYLSLAQRVLLGISLMSTSLLLMALVNSLWLAMLVLALFYTGSLVTEPAREALLASYAQSDARAGYTGTSRLGLALGGATGYLGGGWLLDISRSLAMPALPWLILAAIGCITLVALYRQLLHRKPLPRQVQPAC
jgi:DHA1 family multidrug resistance protein-like MFS transporter